MKNVKPTNEQTWRTAVSAFTPGRAQPPSHPATESKDELRARKKRERQNRKRNRR